MDTRLLNELKRRRQEIYKFYYLEIGSAIRKKRLENKLTQEDLAKGICSNTYLSKIEHNAIAVNKDSLFMIMERINMSTEEYGFPEEMVNYMEKSIDFFFKGDKSGFRTLYEDSLQYQFGILVEVSRLGYFVMIGDKINAKVLYDELHRYLCSVENYGITIFTLFSCFYHILMDDYEAARLIYEQTKDYHASGEQIFGLFEFAKFIIYSRLGYANFARDGYENAKNIFISYGAINRIVEISFYLNLFKCFEGSTSLLETDIDFYLICNHNHVNEYIIAKSFIDTDPVNQLRKIREGSPYFPEALFLLGRHYIQTNNLEEYNHVHEQLETYYQTPSDGNVNYLTLIECLEKEQMTAYKDYLISNVLPNVSRIQSIFFMTKVTNEIIDILSKTKRYKDAISYQIKLNKSVQKMKTLKK